MVTCDAEFLKSPDFRHEALLAAISEKEAQIALNFYPNPFSTSGNLNLISDNGGDFAVRILDSNGKLVWSKNLPGNNIYTIGEQLPTGIYIVEVLDGNNKQTLKLVKL